MLDKVNCATCEKRTGVWKCEGCSQSYCFDHVVEHRQALSKQMEDVECTRDFFRQTLTEHIDGCQDQSLLAKINAWEEESIKKVRQKADDARRAAAQGTVKHMTDLQARLARLTEELRRGRQENNFLETDLYRWKLKLAQLEEDLRSQSALAKLQSEPTPLMVKTPVKSPVFSGFSRSAPDAQPPAPPSPRIVVPQLVLPPTRFAQRWARHGITVAGGHGSGSEANQLCNPVSVRTDENAEHLFIADYWNNRVMKYQADTTRGYTFMNDTATIAGSNPVSRVSDVLIDEDNDCVYISDTGNRQILRKSRHDATPAKIIISDIDCWGMAMDRSGNLYVSDYKRHEVRRWRMGDKQGTVVAGGNQRGSRVDQLDSPTGVFVDDEDSVYVSDHFNHRVMKWKAGAKEGIVVAGDQTEGNSLTQLSGPTGLFVDRFGSIFVSDCNNHRVVRYWKGATKGSVIVGGNGYGYESDQLFHPRGLSRDEHGNLYVADSANHRIQKFTLES